jgi:hypothetical protein
LLLLALLALEMGFQSCFRQSYLVLKVLLPQNHRLRNRILLPQVRQMLEPRLMMYRIRHLMTLRNLVDCLR